MEMKNELKNTVIKNEKTFNCSINTKANLNVSIEAIVTVSQEKHSAAVKNAGLGDGTGYSETMNVVLIVDGKEFKANIAGTGTASSVTSVLAMIYINKKSNFNFPLSAQLRCDYSKATAYENSLQATRLASHIAIQNKIAANEIEMNR